MVCLVNRCVILLFVVSCSAALSKSWLKSLTRALYPRNVKPYQARQYSPNQQSPWDEGQYALPYAERFWNGEEYNPYGVNPEPVDHAIGYYTYPYLPYGHWKIVDYYASKDTDQDLQEANPEGFSTRKASSVLEHPSFGYLQPNDKFQPTQKGFYGYFIPLSVFEESKKQQTATDLDKGKKNENNSNNSDKSDLKPVEGFNWKDPSNVRKMDKILKEINQKGKDEKHGQNNIKLPNKELKTTEDSASTENENHQNLKSSTTKPITAENPIPTIYDDDQTLNENLEQGNETTAKVVESPKDEEETEQEKKPLTSKLTEESSEQEKLSNEQNMIR